MLQDLPEFDSTRTDYDERELELYADKLIRESSPDPGCPVLFQEHIEPRWRKEVGVASGTPDAVITASMSNDGQMLYNRTHPQGRKVNSREQRSRNRASYYR
jgi:hypothetical protein